MWVVVTLYNLLMDVTPAENFLRRRAPEVGGWVALIGVVRSEPQHAACIRALPD